MVRAIKQQWNNGPGNSCDCGDDNERMLHWSIKRPTCLGLEFNCVVGPLLLKLELHVQCIENVRDFVEQVAGAPDLLEESTNCTRHLSFCATTIRFNVRPIQLMGKVIFGRPFVPFLLARVEDIREQLKAMDDGNFPRGPHQPVKEAIYEECVDRRSTQPPEVACDNETDFTTVVMRTTGRFLINALTKLVLAYMALLISIVGAFKKESNPQVWSQ